MITSVMETCTSESSDGNSSILLISNLLGCNLFEIPANPPSSAFPVLFLPADLVLWRCFHHWSLSQFQQPSDLIVQ